MPTITVPVDPGTRSGVGDWRSRPAGWSSGSGDNVAVNREGPLVPRGCAFGYLGATWGREATRLVARFRV